MTANKELIKALSIKNAVLKTRNRQLLQLVESRKVCTTARALFVQHTHTHTQRLTGSVSLSMCALTATTHGSATTSTPNTGC